MLAEDTRDKEWKERRMQRRRLIADNLPASLLSNESLFGACRRLRSAHKTQQNISSWQGRNFCHSNIITITKNNENDQHRLLPSTLIRRTNGTSLIKLYCKNF